MSHPSKTTKHSPRGIACAKPKPYPTNLNVKDWGCPADKHLPQAYIDRHADRPYQDNCLDMDGLWIIREKQKHHEWMKTKVKPQKSTKHCTNKPESAERVGGRWCIVEHDIPDKTDKNEGYGEEGLEVGWGKENGRDDEGWMLIHTIVGKEGRLALGDEEWENI